MHVLKTFAWILLLLFLGVLGSLGIFVSAASIIDTKITLPTGPFIYTDAWERGYVSAEGTLTIDNARSAFPLQVTKLRCYREDKVCTGATAEIAFGNMLNLSLFRHDVVLWNNTTLVFREDAACVLYLYTIDRTTKRLVGTRSKKPNVQGCETFEDRSLSLSLVNGFDIWLKLNQESGAKVLPFMWFALAAWWIALGMFGWRLRPKRRHT